MKATIKKVGAPQKYKPKVETTTLHILIPKETKNQCLEAIEKIVKKFINV